MRKYIIETTEEYDKAFDKLDKSLQIQIEDEIEQLEINPYVGKPLGYKFFREKKIKSHRIYYLIYDEYLMVFIVTLSDKRAQQTTINSIKRRIPYYRESIKKRINEQ
jgi:mRNA-degrading endonuclease RelE of RelBE toxin-antitoxin system